MSDAAKSEKRPGAGNDARPAKKSKTIGKAAAAEEEWNAEDWTEEQATAKKKSKSGKSKKANAPKADDLMPGTVILYGDGWRGVIREAFAEIDQFWVADEESGETVTDESTGDPAEFKAADLQLVAPVPVAKPRPEALRHMPLGGVFLLGTEDHIIKILEHFGAPLADERNDPQQLLAMPCSQCDIASLLPLASEEVEPTIRKLAQDLRPDIHVALRSYHLKQAVEKLGASLLRLGQHYCLSALKLPYTAEDIDAASCEWTRHWRGEICNQMDLCVSAGGCFPDELTPEDAARRALGEQCGIRIAEEMWENEEQSRIRKLLGASGLPLAFTDDNCMRVFVLILPEEAEISVVDGIMCFEQGEPKEQPEQPFLREEVSASAAKQKAPRPTADQAAEKTVGGKTVAQWEQEQHEFASLQKLPADWLRIRSKSTNEVYFFNKKTHESTFTFPETPLPPGWTKQVSKSTGKAYYFNASRNESRFERPTS